MNPILNVAVSAARNAGNYIARASERLDLIKTERKDTNDFVTNVDKKAESIIIEAVRENYPDHGIIAEEGSHHEGDEFQWVIDPLDGTTNFIHGIPQFAISIGIKHKGRLQFGVIYDPMRQELFTAIRGSGAQLNSRRIRVSQHKSLDGSLLATSFPFRQRDKLDIYQQTFNAIYAQCNDIRRAGSAALDLAYVAAGRLDGYWEFGLSPWDFAAGVLLVKEAGGMVADLDGSENYLETGNILAGNPKVFKGLLQKVHPFVAAPG
ncbi:MAG: inositol-1-monophosphatase [Legionellales bacterium]|nr:inositol-1-monophosphatase [Legionellales bacterium]